MAINLTGDKIYLIDTHAHLNYPAILKNLPEILSRAEDKGIKKIIIPATNYVSSTEIAELIQKHDILYGAAGIHPSEVSSFKQEQLKGIQEIASVKKIVAIGEIGLDYYWKPYDRNLQIYLLDSQIQIALDSDLPVILHNRESSKDLMNTVEKYYKNGKLKAQFHSFSGDMSMAMKCVEMGFYLSFTGNITYKPKASTLNAIDILKKISLENLLLETDTPYLPPLPHRGKQNEPSFLIHTAEKISQIKGIRISELAYSTTQNALRLFRLN